MICPKQLSAVNTSLNGNREMNHIIQSMMKRMASFIRSIRSLADEEYKVIFGGRPG